MEYDMFRDYFNFEDMGNSGDGHQFPNGTMPRPLLGRPQDREDFLLKDNIDNKGAPKRNGQVPRLTIDLSGLTIDKSKNYSWRSNDFDIFQTDLLDSPSHMQDFVLDHGHVMNCVRDNDFEIDSKPINNSPVSNPSTRHSSSDRDEELDGSPQLRNWVNPEEHVLLSQDSYFNGSTCFYKNIESDYDCFEQVSPLLPTSVNSFQFEQSTYQNAGSTGHQTRPTNHCGTNAEHLPTKTYLESNANMLALTLLQSLALDSNGCENESFPSVRNGKTLDAIKHCAFCKRNGETREFYSTHIVKDSRGKVVCPILRKYVCPICKATGDSAHTLRHCPFKLPTALQPAC